MLWNEPQNHDVDCYFCNTTLIKGFHAKNKQQIVYGDVPSVAKPVFIHVHVQVSRLFDMNFDTWFGDGSRELPLVFEKNRVLLAYVTFLHGLKNVQKHVFWDF